METLDIKILCEVCNGVIGGSVFDLETGEKPCRCEGKHSNDLLYNDFKKDDNEDSIQ